MRGNKFRTDRIGRWHVWNLQLKLRQSVARQKQNHLNEFEGGQVQTQRRRMRR